MEASVDRRKQPHAPTAGNGNANGVASAAEEEEEGELEEEEEEEKLRLRLRANENHKPERYEDLQMQLEFSPLLFSSLEQYLPFNMLHVSRELKLQYMRHILLRYSPEGERARLKLLELVVIYHVIRSDGSEFEHVSNLPPNYNNNNKVLDPKISGRLWILTSLVRVKRHKEYRQKIILNYQPLHRELYTHEANFFVPSFLKAIAENTEESFRSIMVEPSPGIYTFEMLQPRFCELLLSEVENFERWVHEKKFRIMRPNTMNRYGAVLDDFGFETMLEKLMEGFICPISRVFFPEVGGSTLDSHHGFVVEYGVNRDVELGFHVDDSEVTLNVCLGKQFSGGDLFFRGVRCDEHVHSESQPEEIIDYSHVPGRAVLHRGRHRHGARATTSGQRVNLLLWCRSSVFRELKKYQKDFSKWCGECQREKKERQRLAVGATKLELFKRLQKPTS